MNLDENIGLFRNSLNGFNKDDVTMFIKKLSKDYADNEHKYKERIAKLMEEDSTKAQELKNRSADLADAAQAVQKLQKEVEELSAGLNSRNDAMQELNDRLNASSAQADKYKDDANKLLSELRAKDAEIIELKKSASMAESAGADSVAGELESLTDKLGRAEQALKESQDASSDIIDELSRRVEQLSATAEKSGRENAEKDALIEARDAEIKDLTSRLEQSQTKTDDEQKIYENITADLGVIIYSAKKSAEDILTKAAAESEELLAKAKSEADDIITRANMKKLATLEENERSIAQFTEKYNFIRAEHDKLTEGFNALSGEYSAGLLEIAAALEGISSKI